MTRSARRRPRGGGGVGRVLIALTVGSTFTLGCASFGASSDQAQGPAREDVLARAQVWTRTDVARMDLRRGPTGEGAFAPEAVVDCRYADRQMNGNTPKFTCVRPDGDEIKVKYGDDNGEVYAEVAATRLLWALGFGADWMYPVRVRCDGCPEAPGGQPQPGRIREFEVAAIERKLPAREFETEGGWGWPELDRVDPRRGGASMAERDALTLLAVMLQHTDSKSDQQRLVCLDGGDDDAPCRRPFLLVSDLGKTFGKANLLNRDGPGSVNLEAWASTPVWSEPTGCRANLPRSFTGTLDSPVISDAGRRFLAGLLRQLTDRQLRSLFTVARFPARSAADASTGGVDAWVAAFRDKVRQIEERSCLAAGATS